MAADWHVGDIVWAKLGKFPYWPALVVEPTGNVKSPSSKKPMHFVFFFGSNDYAWVFDNCIEKFGPNEQYMKCTRVSFKAALEDLEKYKSDPKKYKAPKFDSLTAPKANGVSPKKTPVNHSKEPESSKKKRKSETPINPKSASKRVASESSSSTPDSISPSNKKFLPLFSKLSSFMNESADSSYNSNAWSPEPVEAILKRQGLVEDSESYVLDMSNVSKVLEERKIEVSESTIGFLGLGILGGCIVKNLIHSKHKLVVWNSSTENCLDGQEGVEIVKTPQDVVAKSDVIFSCVFGPETAKEVVFGNCGVLKAITDRHGYVEVSSVDPDTSRDIAEAIKRTGARYLEAPVLGSRELAINGQLVILAAGDNDLFEQCKSCFQAIGEHAFFLGEIGNASKMNVVINMLMGTVLVSLAEALSLAKRIELSQQNLLEILELGPLNCPLLINKAKAMIEDKFPTSTPLMHMQKILHLAMDLSDKCVQPLPTTAAACEVYKHAKYLGYGRHDVAAVYRARF